MTTSTTMATPNIKTSSNKLPWTTCVMGCDIKESSEVTLLKCFHALCSVSCVEKFKAAISQGQHVTNCVPCKSPEHAFKSSRKIVLANFFPRKKIIDELKDPLRCDSCITMGVAKAFCNQCDILLCQRCVDFHLETKTTLHHPLKYNDLEEHRREVCELETHLRKPLLYYCHKCDIKFCRVCASDHVGHVAFVFQSEREDLDLKLIAVKNFIEKCNKTIEGLVANHHRLTTDEWKVAKTYLARKCARLFENWQDEYKKCEPDLKKVFDAMCANIVQKIKCVKKARQFYQDFLVVASEISEKGDQLAVVNFLRFCGKKDDGSIGDSWILNVKKHSSEMDGVLEADCKFMRQEDFAGFKAEVEKIAEKCENLSRVVKRNGFNKIDKKLKLTTTSSTEIETSSQPPITIQGQSQINQRKRHKSVRNPETMTDVAKDDDDTAILENTPNHHHDIEKVMDVDTSTVKSSESENNREVNGNENCNDDAHAHTTEITQNTHKPLEAEVSNHPNSASDKVGSGIEKINGFSKNNTQKSIAQKPETTFETPLLPENPHNHRRRLDMSVEHPGVPQVTVPEDMNGTSEKTQMVHVQAPSTASTDEAVFKTPQIRKRHKSVRFTGLSPVKVAENNVNKTTLNQEMPKEDIGTGIKNISTSKRCDHHDDTEALNIGENPKSHASQSLEINGDPTPSQLSKNSNPDSSDNTGVGNGTDSMQAVAEDEVDIDQNEMGKPLESEIRSRPKRSCGFKANPEMIYVPPTLGGNFGIGTVTMPSKKVVKKSSNSKVKKSKKVQKQSIKKVKRQNERGSVDSNDSGSGRKRPRMASTDPEESEVTVGTSSNPPKKIRRKSEQTFENANLIAEFESAPESTLEDPPSDSDYPLQLPEKMKLSGDLNDGESEDYCCICRDGRDEDDDEEDIIICCDFCTKVYHPRCHIPVINEIPKDDEQWRCNYEIRKKSLDELIAQCNGQNNGDNANIENQVFELVESNKSHFQLACSFFMECHKIPEIPTVRWRFPQKYLEKYGKVPFHLDYLRQRLCLGQPKPFLSTEDMLKAFRQMFIQAFMIYTKKQKYRPEAFKCFTRFLNIVNDYYPQYKTMFSGILDD